MMGRNASGYVSPNRAARNITAFNQLAANRNAARDKAWGVGGTAADMRRFTQLDNAYKKAVRKTAAIERERRKKVARAANGTTRRQRGGPEVSGAWNRRYR